MNSFYHIYSFLAGLTIKDNHDAYLREIADVFHCCPTAIRKALQRLKITRKKDDTLQGTVSGEGSGIRRKNPRKPQRAKSVCRWSRIWQLFIPLTRKSPRGEKIHEKVKGRKYQRTSIVAGKMGANIIAPLEYTGIMHGDFLKLGLRNICFLSSLRCNDNFIAFPQNMNKELK